MLFTLLRKSEGRRRAKNRHARVGLFHAVSVAVFRELVFRVLSPFAAIASRPKKKAAGIVLRIAFHRFSSQGQIAHRSDSIRAASSLIPSRVPGLPHT